MAQSAKLASKRAELPVFYDPTGRRRYWVGGTALVLFLLLTGLAVWLRSVVFAPVWNVSVHGNSGYPAQLLDSGSTQSVPVIGQEARDSLARIDLVIHQGKNVYLADPFSTSVYRRATADETRTIGKNPYALEWFGHPPDHQLVLTFDDGPDPRNTGAILNILSREHVPATFFVVGKNVVRYPSLLQREIREGHTVANHTLSHVGLGHGSGGDREELVGDDRVIRAVGDYETRLFRIPEGNPDDNALAVLRAQQLGYLTVDMDVDTLDWEHKPGHPITMPKLDGHGHIVLLHDGGGNRSETIKLLPKLIEQARAQGYTFVTVAAVVPKTYVPVHGASPAFADRAILLEQQGLLVAPGKVLGWLFWSCASLLIVVSMLDVVLALRNQYQQRRRVWPQPNGSQPLVSAILPVYNEGKVLSTTLDALRRSTYGNLEVVAIDDGSTDDTWAVLRAYAKQWPALRAFSRTPNQGKAAALNFGIAEAKGSIIVTLDGDTVFEPQTIAMLARHFQDPAVAVVAGQVKVGNRRNVATWWQSLEYLMGICVTRTAHGAMGAIYIAPGACAAWRRDVVLAARGFSADTYAEDCSLVLAIHRLGGGCKILQDNEAIAWTEAPMTWRALLRQRYRWNFGILQALRQNRDMVLRPRYGMLGMAVLPYALLSIVVPLVFLPLTYITAALSIAGGNWQGVVLFATFVASVQLAISIVALAIAHESPRHLLVVPVYRLIYEPLRTYLLYATVLAAMAGVAMRWYHPPRTATV